MYCTSETNIKLKMKKREVVSIIIGWKNLIAFEKMGMPVVLLMQTVPALSTPTH